MPGSMRMTSETSWWTIVSRTGLGSDKMLTGNPFAGETLQGCQLWNLCLYKGEESLLGLHRREEGKIWSHFYALYGVIVGSKSLY